MFLGRIHLDFQFHVSPKRQTWLLASTYIFHFCWNFHPKTIDSLRWHVILKDQKWQKVVLVLTYLGIQAHFSWAIFSFFYQCVNRQLFTWGGLFLFQYHKFCSLHPNCVFGWHKLKSALSIEISQLNLLEDYRFFFIKVWIDDASLSDDSQMDQSLIWSLGLDFWWAEHAGKSN